jgi:hypothetical protein
MRLSIGFLHAGLACAPCVLGCPCLASRPPRLRPLPGVPGWTLRVGWLVG